MTMLMRCEPTAICSRLSSHKPTYPPAALKREEILIQMHLSSIYDKGKQGREDAMLSGFTVYWFYRIWHTTRSRMDGLETSNTMATQEDSVAEYFSTMTNLL